MVVKIETLGELTNQMNGYDWGDLAYEGKDPKFLAKCNETIRKFDARMILKQKVVQPMVAQPIKPMEVKVVNFDEPEVIEPVVTMCRDGNYCRYRNCPDKHPEQRCTEYDQWVANGKQGKCQCPSMLAGAGEFDACFGKYKGCPLEHRDLSSLKEFIVPIKWLSDIMNFHKGVCYYGHPDDENEFKLEDVPFVVRRSLLRSMDESGIKYDFWQIAGSSGFGLEIQHIPGQRMPYEQVSEPEPEPKPEPMETLQDTQFYSDQLEQVSNNRKFATTQEDKTYWNTLYALYTLLRGLSASYETKQEPYITLSKKMNELEYRIKLENEKNKKIELVEQVKPLHKQRERYMRWLNDIDGNKSISNKLLDMLEKSPKHFNMLASICKI